MPFLFQSQPSKDGEEGAKIDNEEEKKGEGKQSAEGKTVGKRRGRNVDFCSSLVFLPLLVPKVVSFALDVKQAIQDKWGMKRKCPSHRGRPKGAPTIIFSQGRVPLARE